MIKPNMKFDRPTLVTITAPTCSGKSFLLDAMTKRPTSLKTGLPMEDWEPLFERIVSTTTRPPRAGEQNGVDYFFMSTHDSIEMEQNGEFAELIEFGGTRYGVTKHEMATKMKGELAPIIILEPQGLAAYEQLCRENGWEIFKLYVHVEEALRIKRLNERTSIDVRDAVHDAYEKTERNVMYHIPALEAAEKLIATHTKRLLSITGDERRWINVTRWDAIIPGDDVTRAIKDIEIGIKWRNSQNARLNT